jgi:hypothetical protein
MLTPPRPIGGYRRLLAAQQWNWNPSLQRQENRLTLLRNGKTFPLRGLSKAHGTVKKRHETGLNIFYSGRRPHGVTWLCRISADKGIS